MEKRETQGKPARKQPAQMRMPEPTEEMRAWGAALAAELAEWPGVTVKNAFGMSMVYRGKVIFAALPGTKALHTSDAILLKFGRESPQLQAKMDAEPHIHKTGMERPGAGEGKKWRVFLLRDNGDLQPALQWLLEAFQCARKR